MSKFVRNEHDDHSAFKPQALVWAVNPYMSDSQVRDDVEVMLEDIEADELQSLNDAIWAATTDEERQVAVRAEAAAVADAMQRQMLEAVSAARRHKSKMVLSGVDNCSHLCSVTCNGTIHFFHQWPLLRTIDDCRTVWNIAYRSRYGDVPKTTYSPDMEHRSAVMLFSQCGGNRISPNELYHAAQIFIFSDANPGHVEAIKLKTRGCTFTNFSRNLMKIIDVVRKKRLEAEKAQEGFEGF